MGLRSLPSWRHFNQVFHLAPVSLVPRVMSLALPEHDPLQLPNLPQTTIHAAVPAGLRVTKGTEALFLIFERCRSLVNVVPSFWGLNKASSAHSRKAAGQGSQGMECQPRAAKTVTQKF